MSTKSRELFKSFIEKNHLKRVHNRTGFDHNGKRYGFCVVETGKIPECRNYYSDYDGFLAMAESGDIYVHMVQDPSIYEYSHTNSKGVRVYSLNVPKNIMRKIDNISEL